MWLFSCLISTPLTAPLSLAVCVMCANFGEAVQAGRSWLDLDLFQPEEQ